MIPPPMHERPEYIALRDRIAEQLLRELSIDHDRAWEVANKIAPVAYLAVEDVCTQWHTAVHSSTETIMLTIIRLQQMEPVIKAAQTWHKANKVLGVPIAKLPRSDRELAAEVEIYNNLRAKDN